MAYVPLIPSYTGDFLPSDEPRPFTGHQEPHGLISTPPQVGLLARKPLGVNLKILFQKVMLPDLGFKFYGNTNPRATILGTNITIQEIKLIIRLSC